MPNHGIGRRQREPVEHGERDEVPVRKQVSASRIQTRGQLIPELLESNGPVQVEVPGSGRTDQKSRDTSASALDAPTGL